MKTNTITELSPEKKQLLQDWVKEEKIPGKIQAWFSKESQNTHSDWRLIQVKRGTQLVLSIEAPVEGMPPPLFVQEAYDQLRKEHLQILKKALIQVWFRASGNGTFAALIQANLNTSPTTKAYKTFVSFLERQFPEIISCHHIQTFPFAFFDPSDRSTPMRVDIKTSFGSVFLPIGNTRFSSHVLDWSPRCKSAWLDMPERIKAFIHPNPDDRLLEIHASSGYLAASLAPFFKTVDTLDPLDSSKQSAIKNAHALENANMTVHTGRLEEKWLLSFFSRAENEGKWTIIFNPPKGEPLPSGVIMATASVRPERILLISSNLYEAAKEAKRFRREGYMLRKTIPMDLEPGKESFEILFLFVPDRAGILGDKYNFAKKRDQKIISDPKKAIKSGDVPHFVQRKKPTFSRKG